MTQDLPSPPPAQVAPAGALSGGPSTLKAYALRLRPGEDLRQALQAFARSHGLKAAAILASVGSLRTAAIRYSDHPGATVIQGPFELVSLSGTLSEAGMHVHLSISDAEGHTLGGHLMDGCVVYTTCELVIGELETLRFERAHEPLSGYKELVIAPR